MFEISRWKVVDKKKKFILAIIVEIIVINFLGVRVKKKEKKHVTEVNISYIYKQGIYAKYIKRLLDIVYALLAILCFGWLYIVIALLVRIKLGKPIVFTQYRPGKIDSITGKEQIFKIYKFRSMTDERDKKGELLPDESRLTSFGKALRSSSLDELPEVINILKGDMSIVGPRPQLVKDMVFMTDEERKRHLVRPGLSGLAQVNGRNDIDWEEKFDWDLRYVEKITFWGDMKIILQTVIKAFLKKEGITDKNMITAEDYGDYLLRKKKISKEEYDKKQEESKKLLEK
jgi:Sugar transferases involved in lipopolysaccharide synthesis